MEARVLTANVTSWMATIISLEYLKDFLQIVALLGSIGVSLASVWWIHRQAKALSKKQADKDTP